MSSATIRRALADFFQDANIDGLVRVHHAPPYWADGSEWQLYTNQGATAVGAIHLIEDSESRIAVPALTGVKMVSYRVALMLWYQWLLPSAKITPDSETAWADPLDVIIDGVKDRLRSDPTCGTGSLQSTQPGSQLVWQAAQDENDIKVMRDIPRRLEGKVLSWQAVEFSAYEVIEA